VTDEPRGLEGRSIRTGTWLNRNVFAFGLTSLLGDVCHEMATAVLPQFMTVIGASAASLGFIEGVADSLSSFVKLGAGYYGDKVGHRKPWTVLGYLITAIAKAPFAFAFAWPLILLGRVLGWLGRGIRGPLRDAMLADAVAPEHRGKAFGFHRAGDTVGAVVGPLAAYGVLTWAAADPGIVRSVGNWIPFLAGASGGEFRIIFLLTLVPGLLSVASILFLVRERRRPENRGLRLWSTVRAMPATYRSFLLAVGIFGMADFAPTLMILRATSVLEPSLGIIEASRLATLFYLFRNVVSTVAAYPIGALSDKYSRTGCLALGYGVAVVTFLGFAFAMPSISWLLVCFGLAGVFIAWEEAVEGAAVRDYVAGEQAGTAFGILGLVNGLGDFVSSLMVGFLWSGVEAVWGFIYAAGMGLIGAWCMAAVRPGNPRS
jgi:MFS family permease